MKPENRVYTLAGLIAVLAVVVAFLDASFHHKMLKLAVAGKGLGEPEVVEALSGRRTIDVFNVALTVATFFCFWATSKVEWDKGWKLWVVVLFVLSCVAFAIGGFVRIEA
jgi:hypothetical protein